MDFSRGDFTGRNLSDIPAAEFNGQTIVGSCFSQETPDSEVFPAGMKGVTFISCNLCNVVIPDGNVVGESCQTTRFVVQNDLRDWMLDDADEPVAVLNEQYWVQHGKSVDPEDIPDEFIRRERVLNADYLMDKDTADFKSWFLEVPKIIKIEVPIVTMDVAATRWEEMCATSDFYPFDMKPELLDSIGLKSSVRLRGPITYVTLQGKGVFKGGIGQRTMENDPLTDTPAAKV